MLLSSKKLSKMTGSKYDLVDTTCMTIFFDEICSARDDGVYWRIVRFDMALPKPLFHNEAAASIAPAALNIPGFEKTISTGYFHSINLFHP